jgi:CheY-like chemotaxis protein
VKSKVLLVEDSKLLRMTNERALSKAGYQVGTAADGEEALRAARDQLPDIILLDMLLPKLSGPEVLKALKIDPATMHIPVVVITSLSQKNEEKLMQEGAAAYFEKSSLRLDKSSDYLVAAIKAVLARIDHQKTVELQLREIAAKKAVAVDPPESSAPSASPESWQIEVARVESLHVPLQPNNGARRNKRRRRASKSRSRA